MRLSRFARILLCVAALLMGLLGVLRSERGLAHYSVPYRVHTVVAGLPFGYGYFFRSSFPFPYWTIPQVAGFAFVPYYPARPRSFGAISYSIEHSTFGSSYGAPTKAQAIRSAQMACRHSDCAPIVWVSDGCAAVATNADHSVLGWGYGTTRTYARMAAERGCRQSGGVQCQQRRWICTY